MCSVHACVCMCVVCVFLVCVHVYVLCVCVCVCVDLFHLQGYDSPFLFNAVGDVWTMADRWITKCTYVVS